MLKFDSSYFDKESRNGFMIEPMMKRVWAAQLEVLHQIDTLCKRHDIPYYAYAGTLLGAVRHNGYIPWDDDLDICMLRKDFIRFRHFASRELPPTFRLRGRHFGNCNTMVSRIYNSPSLSTDPVFLDKYHGCPYIVGIDLFIYDNLPGQDTEEEKMMIRLLSIIEELARNWNDSSLSPSDQEEILALLESFCKVSLVRDKALEPQLMLLSDKLQSMYYDIPCEEITTFSSFFRHRNYRFKQDWFSGSVEAPFENTTIPVPIGYHNILSLWYGDDYLTPKLSINSHDYPYYKKQEKMLRASYAEKGLPFPNEFL